MARYRLALAVAVLALVAAGCAASGESDDLPSARETAAAESPASEEVVLQIQSGGDFFVALVARGAEVPLWTLYRDGRVVTARAGGGRADLPAVPVLLERRLTKAGMDAVLLAARRAELRGPDREYVYAEPTDMPTTTFMLATNGEPHVTAAYGLGELDEAPTLDASVPSAHRKPRRKLLHLQWKLLDLERWVPADSISGPRPYEYRTLAVYVQPAEYWFPGRRALEEARESERTWPLREALSDFGDPVDGMPTIRCGSVARRDLERVVVAAKEAEPFAAWESGGAAYVLAFRPLLPGEEPCGHPRS